MKSKLSSFELVIGHFSSKNHITSAVSPSGTPIEDVFYLTIRKSVFFYPYARKIVKNGGVWKGDLGPRKAAVASRIRLHSTPRTFLAQLSCVRKLVINCVGAFPEAKKCALSPHAFFFSFWEINSAEIPVFWKFLYPTSPNGKISISNIRQTFPPHWEDHFDM